MSKKFGTFVNNYKSIELSITYSLGSDNYILYLFFKYGYNRIIYKYIYIYLYISISIYLSLYIYISVLKPILSGNMNIDKLDKMTKIRPFYEMIAKCCIESWLRSPVVSVDESMMPCYGQKNNRELKTNLFDLDVRCGSLLSLLDM